MNQCYIFNETKEDLENEIETLQKLMDFAMKQENLQETEFNVIFVDNQRIYEINKEYRGIDRETDVISFALEDNQDFIMPVRLLGDIYISIPKARGQAAQFHHSFLREICFLAVHGFYHLLGYDHMEKEEEKVMFQKQEDILNAYGITRDNEKGV